MWYQCSDCVEQYFVNLVAFYVKFSDKIGGLYGKTKECIDQALYMSHVINY